MYFTDGDTRLVLKAFMFSPVVLHSLIMRSEALSSNTASTSLETKMILHTSINNHQTKQALTEDSAVSQNTHANSLGLDLTAAKCEGIKALL